MRIYAETIGGKLCHYQDYNEDEVDAVIVLDDGKFALIEIKPGYEDVMDKAALSLLKVAEKSRRSLSSWLLFRVQPRYLSEDQIGYMLSRSLPSDRDSYSLRKNHVHLASMGITDKTV